MSSLMDASCPPHPKSEATRPVISVASLPLPAKAPVLPPIFSDFTHRAILPCIITLFGGLCGLAAVLSAFTGNLDLACWLCLLTYYTDVADGSLARTMGGCSKLGAKLDDVCDITGHGLAGFAILAALHSQPGGPSKVAVGLVGVPFLCVCLCRGAYFSIRVKDYPDLEHKTLPPVLYAGLPTTYVAPTLASIWLLTGSPNLVLLAASVGAFSMLPFCYYPLERMLEHDTWKRCAFSACTLAILFLPFTYGATASLILIGSYTLAPSFWADYSIPKASPLEVFRRATTAPRD